MVESILLLETSLVSIRLCYFQSLLCEYRFPSSFDTRTFLRVPQNYFASFCTLFLGNLPIPMASYTQNRLVATHFRSILDFTLSPRTCSKVTHWTSLLAFPTGNRNSTIEIPEDSSFFCGNSSTLRTQFFQSSQDLLTLFTNS